MSKIDQLKALLFELWQTIWYPGITLERHDRGFVYRYVLTLHLHCADKPAIEYPKGGAKCWFLHNKRHRTDGPAIDFGNPELDRYFIKGRELTQEEYEGRDRSKDAFAEGSV
jgi:hypothetical protein